jgi:hypothetical protein
VLQFALLNVSFKSYIDATSFVQKGTSDTAEVSPPLPPPVPSALAHAGSAADGDGLCMHGLVLCLVLQTSIILSGEKKMQKNEYASVKSLNAKYASPLVLSRIAVRKLCHCVFVFVSVDSTCKY